MSHDFYQTIDKPGFAEFKDRGSRFLAYVFPLADAADFKKNLQQIKEDHPKAAHHCFAYRFGIDGNNFRSSDDGEPSGSAGKPILGQIDSKQLINVGIIVVRYFGGTLLGVPGLINAYKTAASLALQTVPVIQKPIEVNHRIQFDYTKMNEVMRVIKKYNCSVIDQRVELFSVLDAGIPKNNLELVLIKLGEIRDVTVEKL